MFENVAGNGALGQQDIFHIGVQNGSQRISGADHRSCNLHALQRGKTAADRLLQRLAHLRIPGIPQFQSESNHGGFTDPCLLAKFTCGHVGSFVRVFHDVSGNAELSFGKGALFSFQHGQDIFLHTVFLPRKRIRKHLLP